MTTVLNGLLGGAIVGVVATLAASLAGGDRQPTPIAPASRWTASLSAIVYGSVAGGGLVALELFVLGVLAVPPSLGRAAAVAIAWAVLLLLTVRVGVRVVRSTDVERATRRALVVYHLVFGVGFGLWIRLTWIT